MAPSARIATFLVGLTVVFGAAFGLGFTFGPLIGGELTRF